MASRDDEIVVAAHVDAARGHHGVYDGPLLLARDLAQSSLLSQPELWWWWRWGKPRQVAGAVGGTREDAGEVSEGEGAQLSA